MYLSDLHDFMFIFQDHFLKYSSIMCYFLVMCNPKWFQSKQNFGMEKFS